MSRILRFVGGDFYINCVKIKEREGGRGEETQVCGQFQKFRVRFYRNDKI